MIPTYRRLIRILSCSLAIAAVLLCSVCMPALAASWTTLVPAEHISNVYYEGNLRNVVYDFGIQPIVYYKTTGYTSQQGTFFSSLALQIDGQVGFPISYGVYPLGVYSEPGLPLTQSSSGRIAIDVSDFKSDAVVGLSTNFHVGIDFGYRSEPITSDEYYAIEVSWSFTQYSSSGDYLGFLDGATTSYRVQLQDVDGYLSLHKDVYNATSLKLPASDVEYIIPLVHVAVSCTEDADPIHVVSIGFGFDEFTITADTDMLLKESLTLEAIEDELGELNDKADTMINGTDSMNDAADLLTEEQQDLQLQLANAMAELDKLSDISDDLPADQYTDFYGSVSNVTSFLVRAPWLNMTTLMQPIMDFSPLTTILLLLVAFINISILFFGR